MNPVKELLGQGQSVWLDYIRRDLIRTGELKRLVEEDGIRGVTSNPTIFEKAIAGSTDYDEALRAHLAKDPKAEVGNLYESLPSRIFRWRRIFSGPSTTRPVAPTVCELRGLTAPRP
jgi:hypothetical protein